MRLRQVAILATLAAALALGVALGSERFMGLIPCALCYVERWPYRVAIALGLIALAIPSRILCWLLVATFLAAACTAGLHAGVEQHWWPSPLPQCSAPNLGGLTSAERFARMPDRPTKSCEDADYPVPAIPVTFAQANLLYALAVGAGLAILLSRRPRRRS
jgi:disulfide bond formation protein DsbB